MYLVHIRRNSDGLVRVYRENMEWWTGEDGSSDFLWSDGNYACDCNRALFFARAVGEEDPNRKCGDDAFAVRILAEDGTELYVDDDWNESK